MYEQSIIIIGGDKRQEYVYDILTSDGYQCRLLNTVYENFDKLISEYRYIMLPVPASKDKKYIYSSNKEFKLSCDTLAEALNNRQIVFGGSIDKELIYQLERKNIVYHDLNNNEDFLVYNAFLTAQGALKLLLDNTEDYLKQKKALITGFGRIGKALALALSKTGLAVTVCARKDSQINLSECLGFNTIRYTELNNALTDTDFIFNTVPERIFTSQHIKAMKKDVVYLELASAPYGINKVDLTANGYKYADGSSLPGRYTPRAAGEKIAKIIEKLI